MAKFNFLNIDEETRRLMLTEIELDISKKKLFISNRLNDRGKTNYSVYLKESVKNGDE